MFAQTEPGVVLESSETERHTHCDRDLLASSDHQSPAKALFWKRIVRSPQPCLPQIVMKFPRNLTAFYSLILLG